MRDAALRVVRREMNDLRGAVKRHLSKGQDAEFGEWRDEFYRVEHPAFLQKQFAPIVEAYCTLFQLGDVSANLKIFFDGFILAREASLRTKSADQIVDACDVWLENMPDSLTDNVLTILNGVENE